MVLDRRGAGGRGEALTGALTNGGLAAAILLLLAASYWHAGVHLDPPLRWVGLIMAAGYLGVLYLSTFVWTAVGIVVGGRSDDRGVIGISNPCRG